MRVLAQACPRSDLPLAELEALAARHDRPGPRYTSYPTAVQFREDFSPADYRERLQEAAGRSGEPLAAYLHVPFCARRCAYCGCHVVPAAKRSAAEDYLDHLEMEIDLVAGALGPRRGLKVLHLGGGTPTYLTPAQLGRLLGKLGERFPLLEGAEVSVELDPRATSEAHLRTLRSRGVNRVSLGVQDFSAEVQEAIGRGQTAEETLRCYRLCREAGFERINLDLVYGLPRQTLGSFSASIEEVIRLRPDRAAVYGYAHVPWLRRNQEKIDAGALPGPGERLRLFLRAGEMFAAGGYLKIGMDHFALPSDELAAASRAGRLGRGFMGYTPHAALEMVGFGVSSIGHLAGAYVQNQKKLAPYYRMLEAGVLPVERGVRTSRDDEVRRHAIHTLLCNQELPFSSFRRLWGACFEEYFHEEMDQVRGLAGDGLIELREEGISLTPLGSCFRRNVALVFDRYQGPLSGSPARFSRTV